MTYTTYLRNLLKKILAARKRATSSYVSPLQVNLEKVKVAEPKPFVSIHVAVYNEKRVVERLIRACTAQDWAVAPIEPINTDYTDSAKSALNQSNQRVGVANYDPSTSSGSSAARAAAYEVIIADDSTDETTDIAKQTLIDGGWILVSTSGKSPISADDSRLAPIQEDQRESASNQRSSAGEEVELYTFKKEGLPTVKLIHRANRAGFKGGALQRALENTDSRAEYIVVLDADFVPYPDTIEQFVKTFQVLNANSDANENSANVSEYSHELAYQNSPTNSHSPIAAVQGYQWHVLNKSQTWVTRGVRTEYAGSYVIERSYEEIFGGLKQIAGSVYCIRADVLRQFGWGTSITEDFELTLRLYEAGYKVVFTPYIQVPAEAVSTIKRLIRQRMRWAEGASFNIKIMFARMVFGRWVPAATPISADGEPFVGAQDKQMSADSPNVILGSSAKQNDTRIDSGQSPSASLRASQNDKEEIATSFLDKLETPRNDKGGRVWVPSPLTRAEKLEFVYFAFYYLQAAFFVVGTFAWFISETVFAARLPFWTAAFGWSLVFTNLFALPLMNIVGMFLEESDERDYVGVLSFIALSYIVVPFQAYAAIKGFLEKEEGPWFRTPKTGLITDVFGRSTFGKFFGNIFGRPAGVQMSADENRLAPIWPNQFNQLEISAHRRLRFGGSLALLPVSNPFKSSPRVRFVSRGVIAIILVFSMFVNYLAFVGDVLQRPELNQTEAEQSGPTKLGESNLAAARPQEFVAQIERIEVEESTKIASDVDFLYQAYLDGDNLAMFGRALISADGSGANSSTSGESEPTPEVSLGSVGVVRIVYAGGKYLQYDLPGIIGGPTAGQSSVSFETEEGLITFGISASSLKQDITIYSSSGKFSPANAGSNNNLEMSLTMLEGLTMRRQNEKGWQIVDDEQKSTVFFIKNPTLKDLNRVEGEVTMDVVPISARANSSTSVHPWGVGSFHPRGGGEVFLGAGVSAYQVDLSVSPTFLDSASYPVTVTGGIQTNPPYPVFNIADARENNTSDYNYVVTVPGNRNKVGFNKKGANTVGYRIDTGDNLYNMEMAMRERSAAPSSVDGGKITYDLGNMEAVFEVWTDRVKADYILKSKPSKNTIEFNFSNFSQIPTKNVFCPDNPEGSSTPGVGFDSPGVSSGVVRCVKQEEAGSISFWGDDGYGNINNREVFRLEIPEIKDGDGNQIPKDKATLSITNDNECGTNLNECTGLVPEKLVPKYCVAEDANCKEPPGYYDRSGIVTLTIDQNFLDTAVYPVTIDPTSLDASTLSTATAYGSQRHVVRISDGVLVAIHNDSDESIMSALSFDNGVSWAVGGGDPFGRTTSESSAGIATLNNEIHSAINETLATQDKIHYTALGGDIPFKVCRNNDSCTTVDQQQTNTDGIKKTIDTGVDGSKEILAQSFIPSGSVTVTDLQVYMSAKTGSPILNLELRNSKNNRREPDMSSTLATCTNTNPTAGGFTGCNIGNISLTASTTYFIDVYCTISAGNCASADRFDIETRQPAGTDYANGYNLYATNWTAGNNTPTWGFNKHDTNIYVSTVILTDAVGGIDRSNIVIDKNNFPAVSWSLETSGGTKNSAVRFSRAVADPQVTTNWECATAASCTYVKTTDCATDVCGDHIQPVTGVNSASHSVLVKAPSTATNADELVIFMLWTSDTDLDAYAATVNGANYNAWSLLCTTDCETTVDMTRKNLSALAVDDGTNQRVWVGWDDTVLPEIRLSFLNADDNTWTSSPTGSPDMIGSLPSLAYDAQEEDIYVWDKDLSDDTQVHFRKYDINGAVWDSADQVFDLPPAADELIYPSLKEGNAPTTSPGPKLDLVYMEQDTAPIPDTYQVFYHTWHTKETRNYDSPAALPTTEALTITSADNNLSFFYVESEYTNSNSDNTVYVPASISGTANFVVHTFKQTNANSTDEIQISWNGKKVTEACGSGALACTLQIYEWGKTGCTAGWDTLGTPDTTTAAGTEFTLTGTTTNTCYYSGTGDQDDHLGASTAAVRVQTDCTTNCNLQTDVITFTFVPEQILWLLPLALFLPRIMQKFGWRWRRKAYVPISADWRRG